MNGNTDRHYDSVCSWRRRSSSPDRRVGLPGPTLRLLHRAAAPSGSCTFTACDDCVGAPVRDAGAPHLDETGVVSASATGVGLGALIVATGVPRLFAPNTGLRRFRREYRRRRSSSCRCSIC
jgi:hypothetical protein